MDHPGLAEQLVSVKALFDDVRRKALMRLEYEGLHKFVKTFSLSSDFFNYKQSSCFSFIFFFIILSVF